MYTLPFSAAIAEYALHIPQKSELINQTSMFADAEGHPYVATYWREQNSTIPQYHLVYYINHTWLEQVIGFRKTGFSLSGGGTKRIPISRPQIVTWNNGKNLAAALIFRDEERGNKIFNATEEEGRFTAKRRVTMMIWGFCNSSRSRRFFSLFCFWF